MLSLSAAGRLLILCAADHHSLYWALIDTIWEWLFLSLATCSWSVPLVMDVWIGVFFWGHHLMLAAYTCGLSFFKHRWSHRLLSLLARRWSVDHLLRFKQNIIHTCCGVIGHASWHPVCDVVSINRHFARVNELVLTNDAHVSGDCAHLFASYIVIELGWSVTGTSSILKTLVWPDRVVSKGDDLLIACGLVAWKFALVLSSPTLALTSTVIQTVCMYLVVPLLCRRSHLLVQLGGCFCFIVVIFAF